MTPEELAREVLKAKDRYALLSLGSDTPIKPDTEGFLNLEDEDVRRVYLKMAARIHPDKIPGFADGTKAFQALVRAYELCCKPDLRADDSDDSRDEDEEDDEDDDDEEEDEPVTSALPTGFKIGLGSVVRDEVDDEKPEHKPHTPKEKILERLGATAC